MGPVGSTGPRVRHAHVYLLFYEHHCIYIVTRKIGSEHSALSLLQVIKSNVCDGRNLIKLY